MPDKKLSNRSQINKFRPSYTKNQQRRISFLDRFQKSQEQCQQIEMKMTNYYKTVNPADETRQINFSNLYSSKSRQFIKQEPEKSLKPSSTVQTAEPYQKSISKPTQRIKTIQPDYDILDLTYSLITARLPIILPVTLFIVLVAIRYYTIACLINIAIESRARHILWVIVVVGDRIIYFILVVKMSLKTAETKTQIALKSHWNSQQSQIHQLFIVIDRQKLLKSIIRGIIPAQLAFMYIKAPPRKKFEIYTAINYIYASIEAVVYYPFFLIYTTDYVENKFYDRHHRYLDEITFVFVLIAQCIMLGFSIFLLLLGIRRKYGKILFCF